MCEKPCTYMEPWKQTGYTPSTVQVNLTAPAAVAGLSQRTWCSANSRWMTVLKNKEDAGSGPTQAASRWYIWNQLDSISVTLLAVFLRLLLMTCPLHVRVHSFWPFREPYLVFLDELLDERALLCVLVLDHSLKVVIADGYIFQCQCCPCIESVVVICECVGIE